MRVEIEIEDDEVVALRAFMAELLCESRFVPLQEIRNILAARLAAALPRPIQVGDKVQFEWNLGDYRAVVLAVDGKYAWLGYDTLQRPITKELHALAVVAAGDAIRKDDA